MTVANPRVVPLDARLREHLGRLYPGRRVISIEPLGPDTGATQASTTKAAGYGKPVRVILAGDGGEKLQVVWRIATPNPFGHDRRADRAASAIQAFDDFREMPSHIAALDLGVIRADGELVSIRDATEHYLITGYAPGTIYAEDLRAIAANRRVTSLDVARLDGLARYLAALHIPLPDHGQYRRAIRDLVGSGEGIYGIVDGYPDGVPGAPPARLRALEERCAAWRWRLRERGDRLARTHGDFHPFNVVFGDGSVPTLLDASRGGCGDPADDLTAMAVNFLLFAIDDPAAWPHGLGVLWHQWWLRYLGLRPDAELLDVAPPFFAWRVLVVANPTFYPNLSARGRDRLLGFTEDLLDTRLDPHFAEELFP
jgi:hypothetical protein